MFYITFLKTGVEVLHLGLQHSEGNAWPLEYWRQNKGRWRLHTPAIDAYLNREFAKESFGESVESFVLYLEVADFASWGGPPAFHGPEGRTSYKPKSRELWCVAQIDWLEVQHATLSAQYAAYASAVATALERAALASRAPKQFSTERFSAAVSAALRRGKPSQFTRTAYEHAQPVT